MRISKLFKRIASMGMALAMAMSCAAVSAGAISIDDEPNSITDAYVKAEINKVLHVNAHLTSEAVPPLKGPTDVNAWVDEDNMTVTIEFVNEIFAVQSIAAESNEKKGGVSLATVESTQTTPDTVRGTGDRIQYVTFKIADFDTDYTFAATEYVNECEYTSLMGQAGETKEFPITINVGAPE